MLIFSLIKSTIKNSEPFNYDVTNYSDIDLYRITLAFAQLDGMFNIGLLAGNFLCPQVAKIEIKPCLFTSVYAIADGLQFLNFVAFLMN